MKILKIANTKILKCTDDNFFEIVRPFNIELTDIKLGDIVLLPQQEKIIEYECNTVDTQQKKLQAEYSTFDYVVKPVDTINLIAKKFKIEPKEIIRLNNCKRLFVGQKIKLPCGE